MNKEKLNDIICESSSDYDILNDAYNYIENLEQKCKKQKEVIDNTIDYLNNNICYVGEKITIKPYTDLKELLDILKDVSE